MKKQNLVTFLFAVGLFALSLPSLAQNSEKESQKEDQPLSEKVEETAQDVIEETKEAAHKVSQSMKKTRSNRETTRWTALGTLSLIDTWIPTKLGVSVAYNPTPSGSWELEYLRGKISYEFLVEDLGSISDQRLSAFYRSYSQRNSFNFLYGLYYSAYDVTLGSKYLATVSGNPRAYESVKLKALGVTWGIGNRWQTSGGFVWSFDWFAINWPIVELEREASFLNASNDPQLREDVEDVLEFFGDFPTFAVVKAQLGFSF